MDKQVEIQRGRWCGEKERRMAQKRQMEEEKERGRKRGKRIAYK